MPTISTKHTASDLLFLLELARRRNDFESAAEIQRRLRRLGVEITYRPSRLRDELDQAAESK